jgi:hypothetical protein
VPNPLQRLDRPTQKHPKKFHHQIGIPGGISSEWGDGIVGIRSLAMLLGLELPV